MLLSQYRKHSGAPQALLSGLCTPCCVKGEDRSGRRDPSRDFRRLFQAKGSASKSGSRRLLLGGLHLRLTFFNMKKNYFLSNLSLQQNANWFDHVNLTQVQPADTEKMKVWLSFCWGGHWGTMGFFGGGYSTFKTPLALPMSAPLGEAPTGSLCLSSWCPVRLVQYSCGHYKPCHCVVTCQQLRDFTIVTGPRSTEFKRPNCEVSVIITSHLMIQLHYKAGCHMTPPVTWCRHPGQMSITEMTACHALRECVRRNTLTLRWPWLKSGGHASQWQPEWAYT